MFGTSGNLSAVLAHEPLELAITASGKDKGCLVREHILRIDESLNVLEGSYRPSAESRLHIAVVSNTSAGSVVHTHSRWSTILSDVFGGQGGIAISGYEMLKGLRGIDTHNSTEWIPIFENSQDMEALSKDVAAMLAERKDVHAFLLRKHGMYTWGKDIGEAKRHAEVIEFLLDVTGMTGDPGNR